MEISYTVIRSKRKTLAIQIKPDGSVVVRAPMKATQQQVEAAVNKHRGWIEKQVERQRQRFAREQAITPEQIEQLKQQARACIPPKVAYYAAKMGVEPAGITITGAKTRFGSCSGKNRLCFSCFLMQYPEEAIDYVVVHELAHIRHKHHQKAFYALVESILPDYRERRKLLKKIL